jgi:hypothetical protein
MIAERIGIVGAGASGIAAAHALSKLGYRHVTLLERERRIGGKCWTIADGGRSYEVGAGALTRAYHDVLEMMREVGARATPRIGGSAVDLEDGARVHAMTPRTPRDAIRLGVEAARFACELVRHRRILEPGFDGVDPELFVPFADWCRAHHLETLEETVRPWMTGFGYGFACDVPALYALKYMTLFRGPIFELLEGGYGGLMRDVADALPGVDVRLGAAAVRIERSDRGACVRTEEGSFDFDRVIVTTPLDEALGVLDATPLEQDLFARVVYCDYYALGVHTEGMPRARYLFVPEHLDSAHLGEPMFAWRRWAERDVVFFYGFARDPDWEDAARRGAERVAARLGGSIGKELVLKRWRYFPHVASADLASGFYDEIEALQGRRSCYFAGELLAFSCVETVAEYARKLVETHFA